MKTNYYYLPLLICFTIGCSSVVKQAQKQIELIEVEQLKIGKNTEDDLRTLLGNPNQILSLTQQEEIWIYSDLQAKEPLQKASFVFDKKNKILLTSTWIPSESDSVRFEQQALDHFKNVSFIQKDVGETSRHEYSNEIIYDDAHHGITLRVDKKRQTVSAISFGLPKSTSLAKE